MLKLTGYLVGAGVRPGEDKTAQSGREYRSQDRFKVALSAGDMSLPTFYDCETEQVMRTIADAAAYGQSIDLMASTDRYSKLVIVGFAPQARAS